MTQIVYYVFEIREWDWSFMFGVNPMRDRGEAYEPPAIELALDASACLVENILETEGSSCVLAHPPVIIIDVSDCFPAPVVGLFFAAADAQS